MSDTDIFHLAKAAGLSRDWVNAKGEPKQVTQEALRKILEALGLPCATTEQCRDSQHRLEASQGADTLPPLVTAVAGSPVRLPGGQRLAGKHYRIEFEDGGHIEGRFPDAAGPEAELPPLDRHGYHRLLTGDSETTLAVSPGRCFGVADALRAAGANSSATKAGDVRDARLWGLGVQLYSLRRQGDGGLGDFTSLAQLARSAATHGAAALAISPVHAMFSADVTRYSPYGPSSRLFLNALHIDPASVLGEQALAEAIAALGGDTASRLAQMELDELIDWPEAGALRLSLLRRLYERFAASGDQREFDVFRKQSGQALQDHARFEAIHAWRLANGENPYWNTWSEGMRNPRGAEVEAFARQHAQEVRFHEFLQWQAARGLAGAQRSARDAGMPIGLIADLAVGADNGGSQAWSRQEEIINGLSVGAPPDVLNTRGQSWGIGAFSPLAMKAKGFAAYLEMLRAIFSYAGGARIDHVLGLNRLWLVPHGESPENGAYMQYPLQDLLRLIALESWRHRAIVIGEDLGTVPEGFDRTLAQAGLLGIRVMLFEQQHGRFRRPAEWSKDAIATTTTHDLPTIAGWWQGRDIDWQVQLDLLEPGKTEAEARQDRERERAALWQALVDTGCASSDNGNDNADMPAPHANDAPLDEVTSFVAATPAPLAMLPVEDALGLTEQPNLPGTVNSHPNWRRRLPRSVDTVLADPRTAGRLAIMNQSRSYRGKP